MFGIYLDKLFFCLVENEQGRIYIFDTSMEMRVKT